MSDATLDDFKRRLDARQRRHREERLHIREDLFGMEGVDLPPCPSFEGLSFEEAIKAYDKWVETRRRIWAGEPLAEQEPATPPPSPTPTPTQPGPRKRERRQGRLQPIITLADIDPAMTYSFALNKFLPKSRATLPQMVPCNTLNDFAGILEQALPKYNSRFPKWLAQVHARPGKRIKGNPISRLTLNIPQQGTYINVRQLSNEQGHSLDQLLEDTHTLRQTVNATAAERWGHGFIESYTEWGKDLHEANLGAFHLARRLALSINESSAAAREAVMSESAMFTTTGWSQWIGEYLAQRAQSSKGSESTEKDRQLRLSQLWDALKRLFRVVPLELWAAMLGTPIPGLDRLVKGLSETLSWLLLNTDLEADITNWHMRRMQCVALMAKRYEPELGGISIQGMLSQVLLGKVEAHLGPMLVPYAVLLAANLDFSGRGDADDLRRWLDADVWQNVDARLLMLTKLDSSVKHNVTTLMSTAVHELGLAPLEGMRRT